ncbi:alpha/beta fold hydrolase [Alloyangia pacifica]|uniref:Lysophospholipase n=1 Tax=Alloyangia pacifica TaxID=311180 RepID=A0A1I6WAR5_9RHOB|nr:alpha/beta hydrolase [Alloyangia pacifica]SDI50258.1 lysophospholipase [Alloyangia pacifica]SFT23068.1 lysophospholipase [Alloyangia pacifica]
MFEAAPFHAELADGPDGGRAFWVRAEDGLRLRIAHYPGPAKAEGTVLLFPGRTEYVEKYGRVSQEFAARGFHVLTIDWRGQGLADRMLEDVQTGHVHLFADYQKDVAALLDAVDVLGLPRPLHLLAHSMGGAIGLRALTRGLPVAAAGFTAPMWGIRMFGPVRPAAWALSWSGARMGMGHFYAPSTGPGSYLSRTAFEGNVLTTDRASWDYMLRQVTEVPQLQLGGPSLRWLHEALAECLSLSRRPAPEVPCLTYLGSNERVVDPARIRARMASWPGGRLEVVQAGEHEVLMEDVVTRGRIVSQLVAHYRQGAEQAQPAEQA